VKVQHPGIREAFTNDLANVQQIARVATTFVMPSEDARAFLGGVKDGFLAELDYAREAANTELFARLVQGDADIEVPAVVRGRSSARVLTTTFVAGVPVEAARAFDAVLRRRQAAAIRRLVLGTLFDRGVLYADAHAGNFLFRASGSVGVLDFGSVFAFDEDQRGALRELRREIERGDLTAFEAAVARLLGIDNARVVSAIAGTQWIAIGGLVRGEACDASRVRRITDRIPAMKRVLLRERFTLPPFVPFLMRTMLALNALLAALDAPDSGPLGGLSPDAPLAGLHPPCSRGDDVEV
jgi:predicted unusual protein kinase regulating ubiquinone biosynthesis (AarF/ABC1/UbiB family)